MCTACVIRTRQSVLRLASCSQKTSMHLPATLEVEAMERLQRLPLLLVAFLQCQEMHGSFLLAGSHALSDEVPVSASCIRLHAARQTPSCSSPQRSQARLVDTTPHRP